ncbi:S8 family peptidase, partial [Armatimonas sp.]|uniref:S8 family peptidase n=1 Tax=Armatimonas sp. TaxID=1872638 RepID=UPI0037535D78
MKKTTIFLALLLGSSLTTSAFAQKEAAKADAFLAPKLSAARPSTTGWTSVILKIDGALTPEREAQLTALGGDITRRLAFIGSVSLRVPSRNLAKLAALPFVARLSADVAVKKNDEFITQRTGATTAWSSYGVQGTGVGVAVLDSGIDDLDDLRNQIKANVKFGTGTNTDDDCGHGTHVAGIIAGNGARSTGSDCFRTFKGVAPQANLINVAVLNQYGQGTVTNVLSGLQWCITNKTRYNIRVLNLSLGHPVGESYTTDPLCQAVEAAYRAGIVVVCAAGNNGRANVAQTAGMDNEGYGTNYGSINSPGNDPYVITVGAVKRMNADRAYDRIATYSGRGPSRLDFIMKPDIVAPGNRVISTMKDGTYLDNTARATNQVMQSEYKTGATSISDRYFYLSGTSMAAPVVAGAAALLLQKYPTLTPDSVKARLMISADKWMTPSGGWDVTAYGAGYLNI